SLVAILVRIIQRVLHARQVISRNAEPARIALHADREHDRLRLQRLAGFQPNLEVRLLPGDRNDFRAGAKVHAMASQSLAPALEDGLAHTRRELERAAQRQHVRLGHHVLAFLVALDRVRVRGALLEQHVRDAVLGRAGRGAHSAWPGPDNGDLERRGHGPWKTMAPSTVLRPCPSWSEYVRPTPPGMPGVFAPAAEKKPANSPRTVPWIGLMMPWL